MANDLEFKNTPLFGGALTADLPSTYQDVSDLRQVPDNQEVYLDANGYGSVIVEILERVEEEGRDDDQAALKLHLRDLLDIDDEEDAAGVGYQVQIGESIPLPNFPDMAVALTALALSPPGEKMRGREHEPEIVGLCVGLVRLKEQKTDLVVCVNVPHVPGEGGFVSGMEVDLRGGAGKGRLMERGEKVRERVLKTLRVVDWDLFVN